MSGAIDYSLGLATKGFLGPLNLASGALASFAGATLSVTGVLAKAFAQIERGDALNDLSARTGVAVSQLAKLEEGFKLGGLEAGKLPAVLQFLQKSLSGINEDGESSAEGFKALGLSMES